MAVIERLNAPPDDRPDPDALLAKIQQEEHAALRGKLRIYFGSNAGVGKTCAMLAAAQREVMRGRDLLAGVVETHGRRETAELLAGLEELPRASILHRDYTLSEFDLDAALLRHPSLVLVDELAHSNVPGSRHPKRWQDVEELLRAGIDVWTTLNVQHLESLNDIVSGIIGIRIRETVPDHVFDDAHEVVVVDLPPDDLLRRLKEGKVYLAPQAERASRHFFRKGNLLALRELALRRTADRVDSQMRLYRRERSINTLWPARERLLVGMAGDAGDERLVREAARLAQKLEADWMVVHVASAQRQGTSASRYLTAMKSLALAAEFGADTATLPGMDVAEALATCARELNANRLMLGHRPRKAWQFWHQSVSDRISRHHPQIDQIVIAHGLLPDVAPIKAAETQPALSGRALAYLWASLACFAATAVAALLLQVFDLANVVMLFLLTVVLVALRYGRGPGVWAAMLAVLCFDFFFVQPRLSFTVNDTQYFFTFALMLGIALITGQLTARLRHEARTAAARERRATSLARLARDLSAALTVEQISEVALHTFSAVFEARVGLALPDAAEGVHSIGAGLLPIDESIAQWTYDHGQPAGQGTDTLAAAKGCYLPLKAPMRVRGVLVLELVQSERLNEPEERRLLEACMSQLAIALERVHFVEVAQSTLVQMEGEKMRNTLLAAISHDLRTPLTTLIGAADTALPHAPPGPLTDLLLGIHDQATSMQRLIENLLDMARMQERGVRLNRQWHSLEEIVGSALRQLREPLAGHTLQTDIAAQLPLVEIDALLIERVLVNLLDNAAKYTPAGTRVSVAAQQVEELIVLEVSDNGPGCPAGNNPHSLFEPFTRGQQESAVAGIGLGLALAKRIIEAHGGRIAAQRNADQGMRFVITLPAGTPPSMETL
ncbi:MULTISPECIES: sensor histidine kinase KdpD [unclassified Pseudomonas]|uniref:sensor histidine kinase KdpD n=1 Tax=unclassified Pseudomonas TaxID=196821 RepID=UPI002AC9D3EE|nr:MULTISPECIES: sensor histidine kinase KdpD [unclassified Pseudomonas]MEB0045303.1 sensor histidine kinase KdpD [Pseudomonas sp. Dout3]MEB0098373.1 sensor histidine kinase KdpD [Pseudomonas sp. DC1.2]WPX60643.1 sensor histidine kinase KdpD [Pseudomonas sp. DC1.2]